jgi:hypothetical protein
MKKCTRCPSGLYAQAWFDPPTHAAIDALLVDGLPESFEAWYAVARNQVRDARRRGLLPVQIHVAPEAFVRWCQLTGRRIKRLALEEYAAECARRLWGAAA